MSVLKELTVEDLVSLGEGEEHTCTESIHVNTDVLALYAEMVAHRRWFHANPENSFEEVLTAAKVTQELLAMGIQKADMWTEIGKTGVVAMIHGGAGAGPCIMLRADMDALSIQETSTVAYASKNANCMHACGHDGMYACPVCHVCPACMCAVRILHTIRANLTPSAPAGHMSALLIAAKVLFCEKARLKGSIKLCFQPAEEGRNGATAMIKDGLLTGQGKCGGPHVDFVYGIHLWSFERLGAIQCSDGPVMAASDKFTIEVEGKGGHGAVPHKAVGAYCVMCAVCCAPCPKGTEY